MALHLATGSGMPHICFLAPGILDVLSLDRAALSAGGAEFQQSQIIRGLRDAGYPVTVVTRAEDHPDEFVQDGIRIVRIVHRGREIPVLRNVHPKLTSIWNALLRANADIYYQRCAGSATLVAGLFSRRHRRHFIYSGAHDLDFQRYRTKELFEGRGGWRDNKMYQWGFGMADVIVAQHDGQVADCRRWYGREAVEIPNCYSPPQVVKASRDGVILWVATVKSWKRPELFLELARSLPQLSFRMVGGAGSGKEVDVYEKIRDAAAAMPNVEFVGFMPLPMVEAHFDAARVFVNTSDYEGFPNTFLQSWARGIPTVSFIDCGARLGDRPVGYISKDLNEMKQTVQRLYEDDALWAEDGQRAKCYFQAKHSVAIAVEKYGRLFEQVLAAKGRR